jgi:predicted Zn-dependent protease
LLRISQAYHHAQKGDEYMEKNEMDNALQEYSAATKLYPENPELPFWTAVTLAQTGELQEALSIFKDVFSRNKNLRELVPRIVQAGFLTVDQNVLQQILAQ